MFENFFVILQLRICVTLLFNLENLFIMSKHPQWATKHKRKGTELRLINGTYYLYEVTSKWDKELKRSRKITGKLLGKITKEDGFIESPKRKLEKQKCIPSKLSVKEYGIAFFIDKYLNEYAKLLKKHFPDDWKIIMALVYGRLAYQSPMKNMEFHYLNSYLSEKYKKLPLPAKQLSSFMREFGQKREEIVSFFREFKSETNNILFDGTELLSKSKLMDITQYSRTKKGTYDSLTNLMFAFSVDMRLPLYYRILPGKIKDIKAFKLSLEELNIPDVTIIVDKGFYSESNVNKLKEADLKFILPLKRNSKLIQYDIIKKGDKRAFEGFFKFQKRIIWYYTYEIDGQKVNVYVDERLKNDEEKDYLERVDKLPENYDMDTFFDKQFHFGTIALLHNTEKDAETVFVQYKSRREIEEMIDVMKNILKADNSYMQNEKAFETWMFITYISLHWYYKIYQLLAKYELTSRYSVMDFIIFLREIRKVKINGKWQLAEITKHAAQLLEKINMHIT